MQEYYFSGTIQRVIFENASNFFRILLLEIDETDSDFEDFEIIVTGTMGDVMEGEDYTFWGQNLLPVGLSSISLATILRELVRKQLSALSIFMEKILLTKFSRTRAS